VVLKNPQARTVDYEYWTCTTLALRVGPEQPSNRRAEIVAPIQAPDAGLVEESSEGDESAGAGRAVSKIALLRNWPTMANTRDGARYAGREFLGC
jgi:hypothetical protein